MESLKKVIFNHQEENIAYAMGLSDGEVDSVLDVVRSLRDKEMTVTEIMEYLINYFNDKYLLFSLYALSCDIVQSKIKSNPLEFFMKFLR